MRKFKKLSIAISVVLVIGLLSSCSTYDNFKAAFFGEGTTSDTIKIGVYEPQTGADSDKGKLEIMGIELAKERYSEVLGKKIELVYADTQSSIYTAETAIQDLILKKPAVILGSYGEAASLVASSYILDAKIPSITISTTNPLITVNNDYYFRMCFLESTQGESLAEYAVKALRANTFGVIKVKNDDTTSPIIRKFTSKIKKLTDRDDNVSSTIEVDPDALDYSDYLLKLYQSGATAVFTPVTQTIAENIFKKADELKLYNVTFLGTKDWESEDFIKMAAKYPKIKFAIASEYNKNVGSTETADQFLDAFKEKYGEAAEPETATALAYDAYVLAIKSIEKAKTVESTSLRDTLAVTKNFDGAAGQISFNSIGDPKKPINIDVLRNGKFVTIYTVE